MMIYLNSYGLHFCMFHDIYIYLFVERRYIYIYLLNDVFMQHQLDNV